MQTASHILSVVAEARNEIIGAEIYSSEFYRKERAAYLFFRKNKCKTALGLSFHPQGSGALCLPAGKIQIKTGEKPFPFFQNALGAIVCNVERLDNDRIIKIEFESSGKSGVVILEATGPAGNLWLLDSDFKKRAVLRNREFESGDAYAPPPGARKKPLEELNRELLQEISKSSSGAPLFRSLAANFGGLNDTLAREALCRAGINVDSVCGELSSDDASSIAASFESLLDFFGNPERGYLYSDLPTPQAFPFKLKSIDSEPVRFPSYSLAHMALSGLRKASGETKDNEKTIRKAVASAIRKQKKTVAQIEKDQEDAASYVRQREIADLIKASLDRIPAGAESVALADLYDENSDSVTIKLDPKLSAAENADLYYRKFQKGRDAQPVLARRLEISRADLARLSEIDSALADSFESASARYESEINEIISRPRGSGETKESAQRLPYRIYILSTGAKVFVGKQGADNDETTFKHIKPYELWFHASQCSGSHVGLKFPSKSFAPSKEEIQETAAIAAWFSKARNNKAAPVNYTERRYVRKPRKAKPGLVTIEREKTVMVSPREPSANANP